MATRPTSKKPKIAKKPAPAVRVTSAKKPAAQKMTSHHGTFLGSSEPGYETRGDILVPWGNNSSTVVSANKLSAGIDASQKQIKKSLQSLAAVFAQDFEVSEIELSVSFSADGKFLGFGAGGAMSVKVKIRPTSSHGA